MCELTMSCKHISDQSFLAKLQPPKSSQQVHKEECTQCFDGQDGPSQDGIYICLECFNAGCPEDSGPSRDHARKHWQSNRHPWVLQLRRDEKRIEQANDSEPPHKIHKLAIEEEKEEDKYIYRTSVKCLECNVQDIDPSVGQLPFVIDGILASLSFARQSEVKSWSEELVSCHHIGNLVQQPSSKMAHSGSACCSVDGCALRENLWLCLICGNLGCGRQQYGEMGGNSHGLAHYEASSHAVSVKLGTITPEGLASVFCYACQEDRIDSALAKHLGTFGIDVSSQVVTEKTITELQIEQNLKFDFSMTGQDGQDLRPVFGPGLTGLKNLGNSCYLASVLQSLFSLQPFAQKYTEAFASHPNKCPFATGERVGGSSACLDCQLSKMANGLLSGRYSTKVVDKTGSAYQKGIRPDMFKALIGKGHEEFATMRQQDADEFIRHLLKTIEQNEHRNTERNDPTRSVGFMTEEKLQCTECRRVRYRREKGNVFSIPVPATRVESIEPSQHDGLSDKMSDTNIFAPVRLSDCFALATLAEDIEYNCTFCRHSTKSRKSSRFATFPDVLIVHARRFELVGWVPRKMKVPITINNERIQLDPYAAEERSEDEVTMPDESDTSRTVEPEFNPEVMSSLGSMGFSESRVKRALLATGNTSDPELAMNWLFAHMDDPELDLPLDPAPASSSVSDDTISAENIDMLATMGFSPGQARTALTQTNGDVARAVDWLFSHPDGMQTGNDPLAEPLVPSNQTEPGTTSKPASYRLRAFISHNGPSVHSGHYVAHVRKDVEGSDRWIFFNDEKVVLADDIKEALEQAYVYIFERC